MAGIVAQGRIMEPSRHPSVRDAQDGDKHANGHSDERTQLDSEALLKCIIKNDGTRAHSLPAW